VIQSFDLIECFKKIGLSIGLSIDVYDTGGPGLSHSTPKLAFIPSPPLPPPPGVYWDVSSKKRYRAEIYPPGGKRKRLGRFRDEVEAALAYDAAVRELGLPTSRLNFPNGPPPRPDKPSGEHPMICIHSGERDIEA
jgi:hypothetical protein